MTDYGTMRELEDLLKKRREEMPEGSYTVDLYEQGLVKILDKLGEEFAELMVASALDTEERIVNEAADTLFHFLVLLSFIGLDFKELSGSEIENTAAGKDELFASSAKEFGKLIWVVANLQSVERQDLEICLGRFFASVSSLLRINKIDLDKVEAELKSRMKNKQ